MNLGGIKVGAAEIERVVGGLGGTDEVAAIAIAPSGGGPSSSLTFAKRFLYACGISMISAFH